ncbi:MAG: iron-sulfur cluster assembly accessory protein [gamma proteobacterium symbiont of Ctena orbiculata]|uniref:Iron-sulfur cluster assembly accessory protein n=1 Tax=Candidatus Thiodiazotropha taylori TaxID=2792791 RepID=A0A944M7E3_9GAMM|nr:iron-sulfur cluster assembly accessory protein [Candidatus Thiodiazotropha taylori]PUB84460.1 MAG: iron-sulfur cluster assembly accessory protein [gamma proteobacterium symbiont of Ctena orbiculata]MBT2988480.1 iron-sulfur cluster assembly accessory protein [Candidatus Thiodiazotropha taylori]MBT2997386.1 iron-sulfur cluster assembly accessory protein [Candidatus Thiodiazotropha taylori]MBT3000904.1 iron-sulfur cluster assembly accessory protein [Candidatus Thiodiazotropha taylori]
MFKITPRAAQQIQQAAKMGGTEGMALRFAAQKKEDGSFDYLMGFDDAKDDDIQFDSEGISIIMEPEYFSLLDETTMDFAELDDGESQFIFINPKDSNYTPPKEPVQ